MVSLETLKSEAIEHAEKLGLFQLSKQVTVTWNSRMRSTAGRAFYKESKIELNPKLIEISEEEVLRTFLHELAHLVAHARTAPRRILPHGAEWQQACSDLGIPHEKATHSLPLPRRSQSRNWHYTCSTCKEVVSRARKSTKKYACLKCCKIYNKGRYTKKFALIESYNG